MKLEETSLQDIIENAYELKDGISLRPSMAFAMVSLEEGIKQSDLSPRDAKRARIGLGGALYGRIDHDLAPCAGPGAKAFSNAANCLVRGESLPYHNLIKLEAFNPGSALSVTSPS